MSLDSFSTRDELRVEDATYHIHRLALFAGTDRLPYSLRVLLENLLRNEDGHWVATISTGRASPTCHSRTGRLSAT